MGVIYLFLEDGIGVCGTSIIVIDEARVVAVKPNNFFIRIRIGLKEE